SLDFTLNAEIQQLAAINQPFSEAAKNNISATSIFQSFTQKNQAHAITPSIRQSVTGWQSFLEASSNKANNSIPPFPGYQSSGVESVEPVQPAVFSNHSAENCGIYFQLHRTFIVVPTADSGMILVHQQLAHERILYEQLAASFNEQPIVSQPLMFPSTIECSGPDTILLQELMPLLATIGFKIEPFGNHTFVIQAIPANSIGGNEKNTIELLLEQMKHFNQDLKIPQQEKLLRCISRQQATKAGKELSQQEMSYLVTQLFRCQIPQYTASGSPTYHEFNGNMLLNLFTR
ncbi:MAG: DNA mismatch repair protein MutL, partial [Chitinophagaceae bacterium]